MDQFFVCNDTIFLPLFVIVLDCGSTIVYSSFRFGSGRNVVHIDCGSH